MTGGVNMKKIELRGVLLVSRTGDTRVSDLM